jgi:hypothetical protein
MGLDVQKEGANSGEERKRLEENGRLNLWA